MLLSPFHVLILVAWQLSAFLLSQMVFPIFSNYSPAWRCTNSTSGGLPGLLLEKSLENASNSMAIPSVSKETQLGLDYKPSYSEWSHVCEVHRRCSTASTNGKNSSSTSRLQLELAPSAFHSTAMEFSWVCDSENGGATLQRLYSQVQFVGTLVGMAVFGTISDAFGRKWVSVATLSGAAVAIALSGVAVDATQLLTARFFVGFFIGAKVAFFTLYYELIPPKMRLPFKSMANWGNARLILTLTCFFFPDWRTASFASAALIVPAALIILVFLPESPAWLRNTNRLESARKVELRIAKHTRRELSNEMLMKHESASVTRDAQQGLWALLHNPLLFKRISILWVMWTCAALSSYTLDFSSGQISGNLYVNQAFMSVLISASKLLMVVLDRRCPTFSRRHLHQGSQAIVVVCFTAIAFVTFNYGERSPLIIVIYSIGSMFLEFTWDACTLCAIESVPTSLRSSALASCSTMARIGAILAPFVLALGETWRPAPYLLLSAVGMANLLLSYFCLVDTKNVDLTRVRLQSALEQTKQSQLGKGDDVDDMTTASSSDPLAQVNESEASVESATSKADGTIPLP